MSEGRIDTVLRRALSADPVVSTRVAAAALGALDGRSRHTVLLAALGSLGAVLLLVIAVVTLRHAPRPRTRTAAVVSVGELVVGTPSEGSIWIVSPGADFERGQRRIAVVRGETR